MKLIKVLFIAAIFGVASAQIIENSGATVEYDEFTGQRTCIQAILVPGNIDYGISRYGNSDGAVLFFFLEFNSLTESPFDDFSPSYNEAILVKVGDEVSTWYSFDVAVELTGRLSYLVTVVVPVDTQSVNYMMRTTEEIRIRFDGELRNLDFTYPRDVRSAFSQDFLPTCFPEVGQQG